jgi:transcriptional regulator with XRE-family HTH domain
MDFPKNLKRIRKAKKVSQAKLAEALGVCQGAIANWEAGYREPKLKDLPGIARTLGVEVEDLVR